MAVGAYAAYNLMVRIDGMPPVIVAPSCWAAGFSMALVGMLFGIPAAHQGPVPGGGHAGGAVLHDWAFLRIKWFTNDNVVRLGQRLRPERAGLEDRDPPVEKYLFCLASWWCSRWGQEPGAQPSAANGWPSATWTWPPR